MFGLSILESGHAVRLRDLSTRHDSALANAAPAERPGSAKLA